MYIIDGNLLAFPMLVGLKLFSAKCEPTSVYVPRHVNSLYT